VFRFCSFSILSAQAFLDVLPASSSFLVWLASIARAVLAARVAHSGARIVVYGVAITQLLQR